MQAFCCCCIDIYIFYIVFVVEHICGAFIQNNILASVYYNKPFTHSFRLLCIIKLHIWLFHVLYQIRKTKRYKFLTQFSCALTRGALNGIIIDLCIYS